MLNALIDKLKDGWRLLQTGPVGKFIRWWLGELRLALPPSWQQKLQYALRRVTLILDTEFLKVGVDDNRQLKPLESISLSQDTKLQQEQIEDLLKDQDLLEAPRFLLLSGMAVLRKELTLPAAAEPNLAQVLTFEMDRHTPFRASAVYFDWKILSRDSESGQFQLEIYVVPRNVVDAAVNTLKVRELTVAGVDILEKENTLGLNLLPAYQRNRVVHRKTRTNFILAGAAVILLALVMIQSLYLF